MQKFPEDIQCIIDPILDHGGIYISNIQAAENPSTLKKYNIGAVITAIKGKNLDNKIPKYIQYLYIPAVDHESFDISHYFQVSNQFIHDQRRRTNVLVHCMAGISRSVTLVIAYMIKFMNKSYEKGFNQLKQKRPIIQPNDSFLQQLQKYEINLRKKPLRNRTNKSQISIKTQKFSQNLSQKNTPKKSANFQNTYDQKLKCHIREIFKKKQKQNAFFCI